MAKPQSATKTPTVDVLPRAGLFRLLATLGIILAPHLQRLPIWAVLLVVLVLLWRTASALRGWPMLPRLVRIGLALAAFAGVFASFGRVTGQTAGVALIVVMAALKLTELRARRDLMVMSFLMYFLLITHFLFSQELWTAAYLVVCAILITGVLIDANHPGSALPTRLLLRMGSRMILQALPLMVVIFVLFPRIPGPLWGLPADSGPSRAGLSDSMSPGDISRLIETDEIAFRVRFDGEAPPMRERYWRGPVFAHFDGRRWDSGFRPAEAANPVAELDGPALGYELTLEPNRTPWLLALDLPSRTGLDGDTVINADYQLVLAKGDLRERRLLHLQSHTHYRLQPALSPRLQQLFRQLPPNSNPRALALGRQWRADGLADAAIIDAALKMYRQQPFFYSLHAPATGRNSIDEFLFDTRKGFCEHYASSFTFLMRAAGLPARVVTGYQGGEKNAYGDYYIVHQQDAHAWSEVWLEGRGWVRVDPTAAVAPNRIDRSIGEALAGSGDLPAFLNPANRQGFKFNLEARWDWINAQWNHWVLGYGPDLQQEFLKRFGLIDWSDMILALTAALSLGVGIIGFLLLQRSEPVVPLDPPLKLWRRLQARLARAGLPARPAEGPQDYAERIATARPELAEAIRRLAARYIELRYAGTGTEKDLRAFAADAKTVRL
jgi:transglutaminase-like putative cysteine protease